MGRAVYSVTAHLALLGSGEGGGSERSLARPGLSWARCRHPWPGPGEDPRSFSFSLSLSLYQSGRSSRSSDLLILSWGLRVPWPGSCVSTVLSTTYWLIISNLILYLISNLQLSRYIYDLCGRGVVRQLAEGLRPGGCEASLPVTAEAAYVGLLQLLAANTTPVIQTVDSEVRCYLWPPALLRLRLLACLTVSQRLSILALCAAMASCWLTCRPASKLPLEATSGNLVSF